MASRFEPTSKAPQHERGTSPGDFKLELGISQAPPPAKAKLPDTYGIPLLELLIVDTAYVFVSWEITPEQLQHARADIGEKSFEQRQLVLRLP